MYTTTPACGYTAAPTCAPRSPQQTVTEWMAEIQTFFVQRCNFGRTPTNLVIKVDVGEGGEDGTIEEGVDLSILHTMRTSMMCQRAQALELINEEVLQTSHLR